MKRRSRNGGNNKVNMKRLKSMKMVTKRIMLIMFTEGRHVQNNVVTRTTRTFEP
jgi:hypothetical protein